MKKSIFNLCVFGLFLTLFFASCNKEEYDNEVLQIDDPVETASLRSVTCDNDVIGTFTINRGTVYTYTLAANIPDRNPTVRWEVQPGMTIVSGQGTTRVRVSFSSSFSSGRLTALLNGGQCGVIKQISVAQSSQNRCPNRMTIQYAAGRNGCDDFLIGIYNGLGVTSVTFTFSARHISNRVFQTYNFSTPRNGTITAPLYLPRSVQQSNNIVWIKANVTLSDGTRCSELRKSVRLDCSLGGGGGGGGMR